MQKNHALFKLGNIEFGKYPLFLAPMEDVTDKSFRILCKEFGADMMYTEFVNSDALVRKVNKSINKIEIFDYERPIGIQIYGHLIESMVESAKFVEQFNPDVIDINFGCPVKKVARRGAGSGIMNDIPKMVAMTDAIVKATKLPVTVKTRLGYQDDMKNIVEIAEKLQDVGIHALTIHGRTRSQMYKGEADWTLIGEVKNNPRMRIPIIGNGDVDSPEKAKLMFDRYGVDAIMIGRATIGRPWIFKEVSHYLKTGEFLPEISLKEKCEFVKRHLTISVEIKGEYGGVIHMRRHFAKYFTSIPNFRETRIKLLTAKTQEECNEILDYIAENFSD